MSDVSGEKSQLIECGCGGDGEVCAVDRVVARQPSPAQGTGFLGDPGANLIHPTGASEVTVPPYRSPGMIDVPHDASVTNRPRAEIAGFPKPLAC